MVKVYFRNGEIRTVGAVEAQMLVKHHGASYTPFPKEEMDEAPQAKPKFDTTSDSPYPEWAGDLDEEV